MQMCSRCHKRVAIVFISRMDNESKKMINEGLCLNCAKELGIKPVDDMLSQMGISEDDLNRMSEDLVNALDTDPTESSSEDTGLDAGAPAINLPKLFEQIGFSLKPKNQSAESAPHNDSKKDQKVEKPNPKRKTLESFCTNLTRKAADGKLDKIIGRDHELDRVIQILCRRQKNNPCLIGEPGVGKTAIAEALANKIVSGEVPEKLKECEIYLVDLTALVAGTQFRGQFESRILALINEVKAAGNIILVIDEVHNIVGAGEAEGSMNAANILKPALSRGEIQVIGATTMKEYRKYIEKDSALERRFQPVLVNEPSTEDTEKMLEAIKNYYETFHGVLIPSYIISAAVRLSERYINDRFLPDKAIDLLDEAASHVALSSKENNEYLRVQKQIKQLEASQSALEEKLENAKDEEKETLYQELASIKVEKSQIDEKIGKLEEAVRNLTVTISDLADVIEIWTGIPASDINQAEFEQLGKLEGKIKARIVGQDEAVSAVVRSIKRKRAGVSYRKAPVSFIFAGPTGVGKTELVKVLANILFNQPDMLIRLDMSEYMEKHSVSKIIGAPPGYVGYDEAGQLTEKIRRHPYSVILFDEIEKAHPDVMNILLQILDDGHITDASGRKVNFENTIIVMTTNAGQEQKSAISGFSESKQEQAKDRTEKALLQFLRPEFLNRIDEVITFHSLNDDNFKSIARIMLEDTKSALAIKGIEFTYDDESVAFIAKEGYSAKYGARNMRRYIEKNVEDSLANQIIDNYKKKISKASLTFKDNQLIVACK